MERIRDSRVTSRDLVMRVAAIAVLMLGIGNSEAQPQTPRDAVEKKWEAIRAVAVDQLNRAARVAADADVQARDEATRQASIIAAVDAVEPDDSSAAATVRRLAGAIKTNPEGTEAGVVVAPFVLAGSDRFRGLEITLAALEDDFTRTGASYTWDRSPTLANVWEPPKACGVTEDRLRALDTPRAFFVNFCTEVVAALPATLPNSVQLSPDDRGDYAKRIPQARLACGLDPQPAGATAATTLPEAVAILTITVGVVNRVSAASEGVVPREAAIMSLVARQDAAALATWKMPDSTSCFDSDGIRAHFQQLYWKHAKPKFAVSASWDLFPRKFGFSPDESALPQGEAKTAEVRGDFSYARAAKEVSFGIGVGRAREELTDDLRTYVGPSFSFAHAFSLLPNRPLLTADGTLNVTDGVLPPRLVTGLSMSIQVALEKPESQDARFNSVRVQPHVDFLINETISFRLGIPIKGEIVERKAKEAQPATPTTPEVPAVAGQRSLQWTIPFALVAVLKL